MRRCSLKNVIMIMADQLKASAVELLEKNGYKLNGLDSLRERGVEFCRCYTPHPLCVPARISLFTSQFPHTTGYRNNEKLMDGYLHHGCIDWKNAGYVTGLIGKNHCFEEKERNKYFDYCCECSHGNYSPTKDKGMSWKVLERYNNDTPQGFSDIEICDTHKKGKIADFSKEYHSTEAIAEQSTYFIDSFGVKNPFVLWVSFPCPHEPYICVEEYYKKVQPLAEKLADCYEIPNKKYMPDRMKIIQEIFSIEDKNDLKSVISSYYGNILHIDNAISTIIENLKKNELYDDTIIVFCADHGDFAGQFGMAVKGGVFNDCLTRVPLIVNSYGLTKSKDKSLVNLIDILPTVFSLQGLDIPITFRGRLLPSVTDAKPNDFTVSEYGSGAELLTLKEFYKLKKPYDYITAFESIKWRESEGRRKMIVYDKWKYVHDPMGDIDELYDLSNDVKEIHNLANDESYISIINMMRLKLLDWAISQEDSHNFSKKKYELEPVR